MLAGSFIGVVRVEKSGVRLAGVYAGSMSGLKDKLVCHFKLVADMFRAGLRESPSTDEDRSAG